MTLRIVHEAAYDGPSLWLERPVVRAIVEGRPPGDQPEAIREHLERLDRGLDRSDCEPLPLPPLPAEPGASWLLAWAAIGLQRVAGDDVTFYTARELDSAGQREVVVECRHRQTGFLALRLALRQLNVNSADLESAFARRLSPIAASRRPGAEKRCILEAARARGIPINTLDPRGRIHELGHGVYRRRILHTTTSNTSSIGRSIARDKHLSLHYLAECGLPVPHTLPARDAAQAVASARQIGFPVVIKPIDEGNSAGLHLDLRTEDEVRTAFDNAARVSRSSTVVVQRHLPGRHYRILVIGGRIVGLSERIAAHVTGNGRHTVRELVEIENANPRRGTRKADRLKIIPIDETAMRLLQRQGLKLDDVPPDGQHVQLQRIDDLENGGEAIAQPGAVHPDNATIITSAVRALEIDIAGVDLIAEDISRSIWETSGGILEVNCDTGFALIQFPTSGVDIDPGPAVIETLFPRGAPVRVPLVAVTGGRDTTEISRLIGRMLTEAGHATGVALRDGLYLGETRLSGIESGGTSGKRRVLLNPSVELAVLECPPEEIVAQGLAFEQCDVAVVTSLSGAAPEALGLAEAVVCRTLTAAGTLIVPGDDDGLAAFAQSIGRTVVVLPMETEGSSMAFLGAVEAVRALGIPVDSVLGLLNDTGHASPVL